jgi:NAD(P)H-hydrate epimerase
MNVRPLAREEVRSIDRKAVEEYGMPSICLMENAGRGLADLVERLGIDGPVIICAGKGNNGGDGFVLARHLDYRGYPVRVLLFAEAAALEGDAATNCEIARRGGIAVEQFPERPDPAALAERLADAAWIVDGLLGTGIRGSVRQPFDAVIETVNATARPTLAIDIPSGLDCDTGRPLGIAVRAHHTATFVAPKQGFSAPEAARYTGTVHVLDIGAPRRLLEQFAAGS